MEFVLGGLPRHLDSDMDYASSTGADIIYAFASTTLYFVDATIPFWVAWIGVLVGLFGGLGLAFGVYFAFRVATSSRR